MKRQDRLALFFERERLVLDEVVSAISGFAGLYFGGRACPQLNKLKIEHFFTATNRQTVQAELVFGDRDWPLSHDFLDLILLDHPLDSGLVFKDTLEEALRVLRQDGSLVITGFNRTRLCSWPIQNTFAQDMGCPVKRYSTLELLSLLDQAGFVTKVRYYDFCRFRVLNAILARVIPFLGIGFVIIAKRRVVNLKPLEQMAWDFSPTKILNPRLQTECCDKQKQHD